MLSRTAVLPVLFLAACTAVESPERESDAAAYARQRARLSVLFAHDLAASEDDAAALAVTTAPVAAAASELPPPAAQDPRPAERHIDDREPPRRLPVTGSTSVATTQPSPGPAAAEPPLRRFTPPPGLIDGGRLLDAQFGIGSVGVRVPGTAFDDREDALFWRVRFEGPKEREFGTGFHLGGFATDRGLFTDAAMNNGQRTTLADAAAYGVDAFVHARWTLVDERPFRLPVRVGPFVDWLDVAHEDADASRTFLTFGGRLMLEPELRLLSSGTDALVLFGTLTGDYGGARLREQFPTGRSSATTDRWSLQAAGGLRYYTGNWLCELGYRQGYTAYGDTDTTLAPGVDKTELRQQELFLGLGLRF